MIFSQSCWFHIFRIPKAISHYPLHDLQITFPGLLTCAMLYIRQVKGGIWFGSSVTSTVAKFASVCFYRLSPHVSYSYTLALEKLNIHSLCKRRYRLDMLFFIQVYRGLKSCISPLESVSVCVRTRNVSDFSRFGVCPSNKHCPSARYAYATNEVGIEISICLQWEPFLSFTFYNPAPEIVNNI
jgi:hypothetical protein